VRLPGAGEVDVPHNTGLGVVVPIDTIKEFIRDVR
jgi:hypothetical protein